MASRAAEDYVQLSEPAEVVERLPMATEVTFDAPTLSMGPPPAGQQPAQPQTGQTPAYPNVGGGAQPAYPNDGGAQPAYPNVGGAQPAYPNTVGAQPTTYPNVPPSNTYPGVPPPAGQPPALKQGVSIDLDGDGRPDAIGYDTTGDGRVDTIKLIGSALPAPPPQPGRAPQQIIEVVVPSVAYPGMSIVVQAPDGAKCRAVVPPGVPPGGRLRVQMPTMANHPAPVAQPLPVAQPGGGPQMVEVIVPAGVMPGQQIMVRPPGSAAPVLATVPPGLGADRRMRVHVPAASRPAQPVAPPVARPITQPVAQPIAQPMHAQPQPVQPTPSQADRNHSPANTSVCVVL